MGHLYHFAKSKFTKGYPTKNGGFSHLQEKCAICCRVAPSFLRVGHLELHGPGARNLKTTAMFCSLFGGKKLIEVVAKQISSNSWIYIYMCVCVLVGVDCDKLMQFGKCLWWFFEPIESPNWRDLGMSMIELWNQSR